MDTSNTASETFDLGLVTVTVTLMRRLPSFVMIGVSSSVSKECSERIRSAMDADGDAFPRMRIVVDVRPRGNVSDDTSIYRQISALVSAGLLDTPIRAAVMRCAGLGGVATR